MTKAITKLLFKAIVLTGLFFIIACQKQQDVGKPKQTQVFNNVSAKVDGKNYRIPLDSAVTYTTAWRQKNEANFNNGVPNSFVVSIEALQQLLTEATDNHANLGGIRIYLGTTQAGKINIMAVPVNKTNDDILHYEGETNTTFPTIYEPVEASPCPPVCYLVPNVLNNLK